MGVPGWEGGEGEGEAREVGGDGFEDEAACLGRSAGFLSLVSGGCGERCMGEADWYHFTADAVAREETYPE